MSPRSCADCTTSLSVSLPVEKTAIHNLKITCLHSNSSPETKKLNRKHSKTKEKKYCCYSQLSSPETTQDTLPSKPKQNQKLSLLETRTRKSAKLHATWQCSLGQHTPCPAFPRDTRIFQNQIHSTKNNSRLLNMKKKKHTLFFFF